MNTNQLAKTAFVFPGQGSQTVGMLKEFIDKFSYIKQLIDVSSNILHQDFLKIILEGPAELLNQTIYTQPAMLIADIALWQIWQKETGQFPVLLAGHSLGEYAALVAAEVLSFEEALQLVSKRAHLMQEAVKVGEGAMAAIVGLDPEKIQAICHEVKPYGLVEPANFNSPTQTVLAGQMMAVEKAIELAKLASAKIAKKLPMSIPSHSLLMKEASDKLFEFIQTLTFKTPKIPVVNNVDAKIEEEPTVIIDALKRQLFSPVQWVHTMQYIVEQGITQLVECGPNKVLTGLAKSFSPPLQLYRLGEYQEFLNTREKLCH